MNKLLLLVAVSALVSVGAVPAVTHKKGAKKQEVLAPKPEVGELRPGQKDPKKDFELDPDVDPTHVQPYKPTLMKQYQPRGLNSMPLHKNGVVKQLPEHGGNGEPCGPHEVGHGQSALKALLLAVFGGMFGLHRFYYGYNASGAIQCALTLTFIALHKIVQAAAQMRKAKLTNLTCVGQFSLLLYLMLGLSALLWWGIDIALVFTKYLHPQDDYCLHSLSLVHNYFKS